MTGVSPVGAILFVCKANICRSPAMAFAFESSFAAQAAADVTSAGTDVRGAAEMCSVSADAISVSPDGASFAQQHRSTPLTAAMIAHQDLTIVASRAERSAAAMLLPSGRGSLFTLREALELGREAFAAEELGRIDGVAAGETLAAYAYLLDARRGTVLPKARPRWFRRAESAAEQLDIADFHHERRRAHEAGIDRVLEASTALAGQVAAGLAQIERLSAA